MLPNKGQFDYSVSAKTYDGSDQLGVMKDSTKYFSTRGEASNYGKGLAKRGFESYTAKHARGGNYGFDSAKSATLTNLKNSAIASFNR